MKKVTKRNVEMQVQGDQTFITERIKNDVNGNPRYNLMVFEDGLFIESYNVQAYSAKMAIENYNQRKVGKIYDY